MAERRARDLELLDRLGAHPGIAFSGDVWRVVRKGRDVAQPGNGGGRWAPDGLDVLHTALARDGALAEIHFHLARQPVFPSKLELVLYRWKVATAQTLQLIDLAAVAALGISAQDYGGLVYARTQEIADAAAFLGFDGILAPSARWPCQNLTLFADRLAPGALETVASEPVDWKAWRKSLGPKR